jgi:hypothetical protein
MERLIYFVSNAALSITYGKLKKRPDTTLPEIKVENQADGNIKSTLPMTTVLIHTRKVKYVRL